MITYFFAFVVVVHVAVVVGVFAGSRVWEVDLVVYLVLELTEEKVNTPLLFVEVVEVVMVMVYIACHFLPRPTNRVGMISLCSLGVHDSRIRHLWSCASGSG